MADTTAFDALAAKLPLDHRARFLAVSAQLRNLPPEHDLALAFEALGFAALILGEVPEEVIDVIGGMRSGLNGGEREELEKILAGWVDPNCYLDLRETLRLLKEHHLRVRPETGEITKSFPRTRRWVSRRNVLLPCAAMGLCALCVCVAIMLGFGVLARPHKISSAAVVPLGIIGYHEAEIPDLGGKVGMVLVGGEVLGAFMEDDRGVVVIKPFAKP